MNNPDRRFELKHYRDAVRKSVENAKDIASLDELLEYHEKLAHHPDIDVATAADSAIQHIKQVRAVRVYDRFLAEFREKTSA